MAAKITASLQPYNMFLFNSMLYERVALSRNKGELLQAAEQSTLLVTPEEEIKDPYILEFLGLQEPHSEKDLEEALIQHLADFLLELGYGFTFMARQKRLQIGGESYYLDLLLYHRGLRCLIAIDLKGGLCAFCKGELLLTIPRKRMTK